ncbi:MAG: Gfo/Idh/MocA family protein [Phycisphaeraceae bacterium]
MGGMGHGAMRMLSKRFEEVDKVRVYDINPEKTADCRDLPKVQVCDTLEEALAPEVKFVYITSSNAAHHPLAMAAFERNKAVLCEKPIATTVADATEMVETAERKGLLFQIGFECRYSILYETIHEWVEAGLLGDVVNTHCLYVCSEFHGKGSWRNQLETGGSMFGEKLCHYVDLPRWWIGSSVTEVYCACAPNTVPYYEVRDNYHTTYKFANGAVSHLTFAMHLGETFGGDPLQNTIDQQQDDGHELRYMILGTKGAAATDVFKRSIRRWEFGDSPERMTSKLVERQTWDPKQDGNYFHSTGRQMNDVVRRVANDEPPRTPARDALETMMLVFAADLSADEQRVVKLDELATAGSA